MYGTLLVSVGDGASGDGTNTCLSDGIIKAKEKEEKGNGLGNRPTSVVAEGQLEGQRQGQTDSEGRG